MAEENDRVTIPVVEESLHLDRQTVETGRVRVTTVPEVRTEQVAVPLQRTDAVVERIARNIEIDSVPPVREEGDTRILPVVEERLVKRLFLVEEVRVTPRTTTRQEQQTIELRSQQVLVEREESGGGRFNEE